MSLSSLHHHTSAQPSSSFSRRVVVLDLLRLLAAVLMVQGHTVDAVLDEAVRQGEAHAAWLWLRGLTSVAFLLAAGLSFHLATLRDLAAHRSNRRAVQHRVRRALLLIGLGYLLHLPLRALLAPEDPVARAALSQAIAVDILQCIGVSLLLLEGLALTLPNRRAVEWAACALGVAVLVFSERATHIVPSGTWLPFLQYLTPRGGSLFPLFPWAAHMLLGVWLGGVLLHHPTATLRWLLCAGSFLVVAQLVGLLGASLAQMHLSRLGWVLVAGAVLTRLLPLVRTWPAWAWALSGQTLFIYAFHVLLVYGEGVGLQSWIGPNLRALPAAALAVCVIALSFALALVFARTSSALARRGRKG